MGILEQNEQESDQNFEAPLAFLMRKDVFVDWDHSMSGIEGMDELARHKGVYAEVAEITKQGMEGMLPWGEGFQRRLSIIQPTKSDMDVLAGLYRSSLTPHLQEAVSLAQAVGLNIHIISGGPLQAIIPVASEIGIPADRVYANRLLFDEEGCFAGHVEDHPLAHGRKDMLIESLREEGKIDESVAGVGDGMMDMHAVGNGLRIGFGAYTSRDEVKEIADVFLSDPSFAAVVPLIIGRAGIESIIQHHPNMMYVLALGMRQLEGAVFSGRALGIKQAIMDLLNTVYFNGQTPMN